MTVEALIEKLVTLGPRYAGFRVDARIPPRDGEQSTDLGVEDISLWERSERMGGGGYLTLILGDET